MNKIWMPMLPLVVFVVGLVIINCLIEFYDWHGGDVIIAFAVVIIFSLGLSNIINDKKVL